MCQPYVPKESDGTHLQTLNIDREDGHEERMDQEPVSDEHYDRERAELPDGAGREERDDSQDGVVRAELQCVRRSCTSKALGDALLHRQRDGSLDYCVDLYRRSANGAD